MTRRSRCTSAAPRTCSIRSSARFKRSHRAACTAKSPSSARASKRAVSTFAARTARVRPALPTSPIAPPSKVPPRPSARRALSPRRWHESALAIRGELDVGLVELHPIPQLARDLFVLLVERFAVVGELAAPDRIAATAPQLFPPIGIGERLARRR